MNETAPQPTHHRCGQRIYTGARWDMTGHMCVKPGKYEENGLWYCGTHAPSKVAARREAKAAAGRAQNERLAASVTRGQEMANNVLETLCADGHELSSWDVAPQYSRDGGFHWTGSFVLSGKALRALSGKEL